MPIEKRARRADVLVSLPVPRRRKAGFIVKPFTISPAHWEALRREALRRADAVASLKPDASAVLREILDSWVAKQRPKG
jgi:hypothetical protein